jgi:hypothetical protein
MNDDNQLDAVGIAYYRVVDPGPWVRGAIEDIHSMVLRLGGVVLMHHGHDAFLVLFRADTFTEVEAVLSQADARVDSAGGIEKSRLPAEAIELIFQGDDHDDDA